MHGICRPWVLTLIRYFEEKGIDEIPARLDRNPHPVMMLQLSH
jgi:hypothetical protein